MITFITNYDDNTNCNYAAYCHFAIFPSLELLESNAIASRLSQESLSERRNIFAMSHGTKDELKDQDRIGAINAQNISNFSTISIFSYACDTSINLGSLAATADCTWFGYIDRINVPEPDQELISMYKTLFEFIITYFPTATTRNSIVEFINNLKELCDIKIDELDTFNTDNSSYEPTSGAYQSVHQLWSKLQVWLANDGSAIMHSEASPPIFRW